MTVALGFRDTLRRQVGKSVFLSLFFIGGLGLYWLSQKKQAYADGAFTLSADTISRIKRQKVPLPQKVIVKIDELGKKSDGEFTSEALSSEVKSAYKEIENIYCGLNGSTIFTSPTIPPDTVAGLSEERKEVEAQITKQAQKTAYFRLTKQLIAELKSKPFDFPPEVTARITKVTKKDDNLSERDLFKALELDGIGSGLVPQVKGGIFKTCTGTGTEKKKKKKKKEEEKENKPTTIPCAILLESKLESGKQPEGKVQSKSEIMFALSKATSANARKVLLPDAAVAHLEGLVRVGKGKKDQPLVEEDQDKYIERLQLDFIHLSRAS